MKMSIIVSNNKTHQTTVNLAESTRQVAVTAAVAAGGGSAAVQAAIKTAEIAFYRAAVASCVANGVESEIFRTALLHLGTGGI
jgi:hypothetical protein